MWPIRWIWLFALWLALADSRKASELVAGAVAAAIGASVSGLIAQPGGRAPFAEVAALARLSPHRLAAPLLRFVPDTRLVAIALWRRLARREDVRGATREAPWATEPALRGPAGRLATEVYGSLPPNRYVIGVDEERQVVLFHELTRSEAPLEPGGQR